MGLGEKTSKSKKCHLKEIVSLDTGRLRKIIMNKYEEPRQLQNIITIAGGPGSSGLGGRGTSQTGIFR